MNRKIIIAVSTVVGLGLVFGLLVYYQNQGYIKIFPTDEDKERNKILEIDRSKFAPAEGLPAEKFEEKIKDLEKYKQAVLSNPQDSQAWFIFGQTKEFLNDHAGAVAAWEKAYQLQPLNFVTSVNLANSYQYFIKDYNRAEYYYKKTIETKPDLTAAYQGLMDLYRYNFKEKRAEFEPTIELAVKNDPQNSAQYYSSLVEFLVEKGDSGAHAKEVLEKVRSLDSKAYEDLIAAYPSLK